MRASLHNNGPGVAPWSMPRAATAGLPASKASAAATCISKVFNKLDTHLPTSHVSSVPAVPLESPRPISVDTDVQAQGKVQKATRFQDHQTISELSPDLSCMLVVLNILAAGATVVPYGYLISLMWLQLGRLQVALSIPHARLQFGAYWRQSKSRHG